MHYHSIGKFPHKRHTQFRKEDGSLYSEELFSTEGFGNVSTLLYRCHPPTQIIQVGEPRDIAPKLIHDKQLKHRSLKGFNVDPVDDYIESRKPVLVNSDCAIILSAPRKSMTDYFFKNADADEVIFIHKGTGTLRTMYGNLTFSYGDYLVIPRGTVYQFNFDNEDNRLLIVESYSPVVTPRRYRNDFGQLLEHSPFCERDFRKPTELETHDVKGDFLMYIKKQDNLYPYHYLSHPFDVVGWDGYLYPYAFSIHDFEPITGRVHLPPPIHQTFEGAGFVICSFVPRLYDYHPDSIPAPYHHSNVDSDEVLYYVEGNYKARKGIEVGSITAHPQGIPHGPHPGTIEASLGKKWTDELAVMCDTFRRLFPTKAALDLDDPAYPESWKGEHFPQSAGKA